MIPDLLPILTIIRSLSQHKFINNNSHCKIIYIKTMILPTHDFWCHITRSSTCIRTIFWSHYSSYSHVSYPNISLFIHNQIFWLDVTLNNILFVEISLIFHFYCKYIFRKIKENNWITLILRICTLIKILVKISCKLFIHYNNILLVISSLNLRFFPIWYRKSPPAI